MVDFLLPFGLPRRFEGSWMSFCGLLRVVALILEEVEIFEKMGGKSEEGL